MRKQLSVALVDRRLSGCQVRSGYGGEKENLPSLLNQRISYSFGNNGLNVALKMVVFSASSLRKQLLHLQLY